ncbi:MAG TPA: helix-turn-helix transcriptional regulator [Terriglobales bacterium]|nr:helix-turn-helix transcriptional regulator [Terriglobales bacterium]
MDNDSHVPSPLTGNHTDTTPTAVDGAFLKKLGDKVREARASRGMTRRVLARDSGVSERYLAQLEAGQGNISILLLRDIARALDLRLESLVLDSPEPSVDLVHTIEFLRQLPATDLLKAREMLMHHFGGVDREKRRNRIALIGMRGAGKSTLGAKLAEQLGVPFLELNRSIEQTACVTFGAIFDLYGQSGFRRLERRCLDQILAHHSSFVLATGGGLVSEPATFERLLGACYTVWVRATPADHMQRVVAQGDMRPMEDSREAMDDLERILEAREPLYSRADLEVNTSANGVDACVEMIVRAVSAPQPT